MIKINARYFFLIALSLSACHQKSSTNDSVPVSVITAKAAPYELMHTASGAITSRYLPTVKAQVDGMVKQVLVKPGDLVKQGDLLVVLDDQKYASALKQAEANYRSATASFEAAKQSKMMNEQLVDSGIISKLDWVKSVQEYKNADEQLQGSSEELKRAQIDEDNTQVKAPINGRVATVDVYVGEYIQSMGGQDGNKLLTLVNNNQLVAMFPFSQLKADQFAVGQKVRISNIQHTQVIETQVSAIDPTVDKDSANFNVLASFYNQYNWKIGTAVEAQISTQSFPRAFILPASAVILKSKGFVVYAVSDNVAYEVPVTLIQKTPTETVVTSQLKDNVSVVTYGGSYLGDGVKVRISA